MLVDWTRERKPVLLSTVLILFGGIQFCCEPIPLMNSAERLLHPIPVFPLILQGTHCDAMEKRNKNGKRKEERNKQHRVGIYLNRERRCRELEGFHWYYILILAIAGRMAAIKVDITLLRSLFQFYRRDSISSRRLLSGKFHISFALSTIRYNESTLYVIGFVAR